MVFESTFADDLIRGPLSVNLSDDPANNEVTENEVTDSEITEQLSIVWALRRKVPSVVGALSPTELDVGKLLEAAGCEIPGLQLTVAVEPDPDSPGLILSAVAREVADVEDFEL